MSGTPKLTPEVSEVRPDGTVVGLVTITDRDIARAVTAFAVRSRPDGAHLEVLNGGMVRFGEHEQVFATAETAIVILGRRLGFVKAP